VGMTTMFLKFSLSWGVASDEAMGMRLLKSKQMLGTAA